MAVTGFQLKEKPIVLLEREIYPALEKFDPSEKFGLCEDIKKSMLYIISSLHRLIVLAERYFSRVRCYSRYTIGLRCKSISISASTSCL